MSKKKSTATRRPRVLVLESWAGDATRAVSRQGGNPMAISPTNLARVDAALFGNERWDALLLTGGGDVDPRLYDEKPHKKVYGVSETRDYAELVALDYALENDIPVLGICRGSQLMAIHNGGRLKQHMGGHRGTSHLVWSEPGTTFRRVVGERGYFVSLHHQIVLRHGDGWRVAARCKDGNIEAIESRDGRCLGVQFHPEMDTHQNECSRRIFRWLVLEAARRAGLPDPKRTTPRKPTPTPRAKTHSRRAQFPAGPPLPRTRTRPQPSLTGFDEAARAAARRGRAPVYVSYVCPMCAMRFDKLQDREDHVYWLHGDPVIRVVEPPLGHPDWEPKENGAS